MLLDIRSKSSMQINSIHVNECKCTYKRITLYFSILTAWNLFAKQKKKKKNYRKILVTLISYNFPFLRGIVQDRRTRRSKPLLSILGTDIKLRWSSHDQNHSSFSLSSPLIRFQHHHYINKCKRSKIWVHRMAWMMNNRWLTPQNKTRNKQLRGIFRKIKFLSFSLSLYISQLRQFN